MSYLHPIHGPTWIQNEDLVRFKRYDNTPRGPPARHELDSSGRDDYLRHGGQAGFGGSSLQSVVPKLPQPVEIRVIQPEDNIPQRAIQRRRFDDPMTENERRFVEQGRLEYLRNGDIDERHHERFLSPEPPRYDGNQVQNPLDRIYNESRMRELREEQEKARIFLAQQERRQALEYPPEHYSHHQEFNHHQPNPNPSPWACSDAPTSGPSMMQKNQPQRQWGQHFQHLRQNQLSVKCRLGIKPTSTPIKKTEPVMSKKPANKNSQQKKGPSKSAKVAENSAKNKPKNDKDDDIEIVSIQINKKQNKDGNLAAGAQKSAEKSKVAPAKTKKNRNKSAQQPSKTVSAKPSKPDKEPAKSNESPKTPEKPAENLPKSVETKEIELDDDLPKTIEKVQIEKIASVLVKNTSSKYEDAKFNYDQIQSKPLLKCWPCDQTAENAQGFRSHLATSDHAKMMQKVAEMNDKSAEQMRAYANLREFRKTLGKHFKVSVKCQLCQLSVYGNIQKHRTSKLHLKLKSFIHPICECCNMEFPNRSDFEEHKLSAQHLCTLDQNHDKNGQNQESLEFYDPLAALLFNNQPAAAGTTPKTDDTTEDLFEIEKSQEASRLTLEQVVNYEVPEFDANQTIGKYLFNFLMLRHGHM